MSSINAYHVEVNWNGDGVTWTDEVANLLDFTFRRGRDYASSVSGRIQTGMLRVRLWNTAQRYSPFNTGSPIYGQILPSRKVRIRVNATVVWQGFLDDVLPEATSRDSGFSKVLLRASGPLRWVAERECNTKLYTTILAGTAVGYVLDDAGWPAGDRTIDAGQVTMVRWKADSALQFDTARQDVRKALHHLQDLEEMEFGLISESKDGKVVFEDVHHRMLTPHTVSQATFSDASGAALSYDHIEELDSWRMIYNRFVAEVTAFSVAGSSALWSLAGETPAIGSGASRTFVAMYPVANSPLAGDHVDTWGTVVLIANSQPDGSGSDMTSLITVTTPVQTANTEQIVLVNTDPSRTAYITQLVVYGSPVSKAGPSRVTSEDATSQTNYGKRTFPLGGKFYPSSTRAQQFTDFGLSRYKDPQPLIALTYEASMDDTHMAQALARDISDRVTLVANGTTPAGAQLGISGDFFIESEEHRYDLSNHMVTYRLSYAGATAQAGDGGYWTLGLSTLGQTTRVTV